jgi:hypothetical protein
MIFAARPGKHALLQGAFAATLVASAMFGGASVAAAADGFAALAGSWSGSGTVSVSNGNNERLRCRATYNVSERATAADIDLRCASDSYNFNLKSTVRNQGGAVAGTWSEATRNVSGAISGHIRGSEILVTAEGPAFTANLLVVTRGDRQTVSIRARGGDITGVDVSLSRR